ncbi:class I SAM-dependent methyltransferase [Maricaulis sp. MIT060901]|uniref:class I SAM-dependent methyltransferase n=1 Tax=Maricaulis sp. MIT060901 TaxID=3096993 RepID=UPI00399BE5A3
MIADSIRDRIRDSGPISIASFMTEALFDPTEGFYATKDPIGAGSDFITAPEISQMFGELMGLWIMQSWDDMGRPERFNLVEMGPGRGTMMFDILRTGRALPDFLKAVHVYLIEASAALKSVQAKSLGTSGVQASWIQRLDQVPQGPCLIIGNEFLDCLPIRQAIKIEGKWYERMVGLVDEALSFVRGPQLNTDIEPIPASLLDAPDGALVELRPGDEQVLDQLVAHFETSPGRALFIDYGPADSETGDTLQAIRQHEKVEPLDQPGTADLTARVDFGQLSRNAQTLGLRVAGPVTQGDFLNGLGIEARAAALSQHAPEKRAQIARQLWRLTDPEEMGELFKLIVLDHESMPAPPGFTAR